MVSRPPFPSHSHFEGSNVKPIATVLRGESVDVTRAASGFAAGKAWVLLGRSFSFHNRIRISIAVQTQRIVPTGLSQYSL